MNELKQKLYNRAIAKHGEIQLCPNADGFDGSFTKYNNKLMFWYNIGQDTFAETGVIE